MSVHEKLNSLSNGEPSGWLEETGMELRLQNVHKNARKLALTVLQILHERGMSQTELAERMGVSRQRITKIVKGHENFTFETVDKLEKALGVSLMQIGVSVYKWSFEQNRVFSTVRIPVGGLIFGGRGVIVGPFPDRDDISGGNSLYITNRIRSKRAGILIWSASTDVKTDYSKA